jgi:sugar phosphate isomerase/epimerase
MKRLKLAVRLESLGLPLRRGLKEVESLGVTGVQVDAVGDLAPRTLSETGRREFLHLLRAHNLGLAALGCPLRHGLDVAEGQQARIEHVKRVLSLSFDLAARRVVVQAGRVPEDLETAPGRRLTEALLALGQHGDRCGGVLALETGLESGQVLRALLDRLDTGGLGADLDPGNLLLNGFDPYESARALQERIVYSQARDVRRAGANRPAQEVPVGHGDLDWIQYLGILEEIEYHGWIALVRGSGDNRLADVAEGVSFLRRLIGSE